MRPADEGFVRGPDGATARALEEPGKLYAIYVHHGRVVKDGKPRYQVDAHAMSRELALRLPPGSYAAKWWDTRNGVGVRSETFEVTDASKGARLSSPSYSEDMALIVRTLKSRSH